MTIDATPPPHEWGCRGVADWLKESGFDSYVDLLTNQHKIDGPVLLSLNEIDFREKPLQMTVLGDIKRLSQAIEALRAAWYPQSSSSSEQGRLLAAAPPLSPGSPTAPFHSSSSSAAAATDLVYRRFYENRDLNGLTLNASMRTFHFQERHFINPHLIEKIESPDTPMSCMIKTMLAALYCCIALLLTSLVMVIVHDRVPDMKTYPPLPDLFLDSIPLIPWAFEVCEMLACILGTIWLLVLLFHKHRTILLRRMFSLTGTVFLLRCVTMLITSLSVPGVHLECYSQTHVDMYSKFRQALRIWYGMGMSLRGVRTCGDYMFSGHTTVVTLLNHFVTEYTPDGWHYVHTISWVMNLFSIFFILAGHEHYSIDVFVAFYISSRLFLYYHSMAYHAKSMTEADGRTRIWFPLFWFMESGGHVGRVKNEYELPLPSADTCRRFFRFFGRQLAKVKNAASSGSDDESPSKSPRRKNSGRGGGSSSTNNENLHTKLQKSKNGGGNNETHNGKKLKTATKNGKIKQY